MYIGFAVCPSAFTWRDRGILKAFMLSSELNLKLWFSVSSSVLFEITS